MHWIQLHCMNHFYYNEFIFLYGTAKHFRMDCWNSTNSKTSLNCETLKIPTMSDGSGCLKQCVTHLYIFTTKNFLGETSIMSNTLAIFPPKIMVESAAEEGAIVQPLNNDAFL